MRTYTSNTSNVVVTWTARMLRHSAPSWIKIVDEIGHKLRLPRFVMRPICDLYDIWAGIPKADLIEMDYTRNGKRVPWWLR